MSETRKTPRLRFPEFTDAWEQRKLGDHSEIVAGGTPNTAHSEYWNPKEIPWMSSGEINNKVIYSTDNMISKIGFSNSSAKWVKEKSVLIALAGQGKTRGTVAITEVSLTTNQSIAAIQPDALLYYKYLYQNLEGRYDELRSISSGDGARGGLNKQILSDLIVLTPAIIEQKKIGDFLCNIDNLITLHQRKLDQMKQVRLGMLQKMFPRAGENVPEVRFQGFVEAWEQRKLGELFSFKYGDGNNNPSNGGRYPVFGAGGIQGGYSEYNAEDSVIIGHMGDAGCVSWGEGKHFVTYNGTITKPKSERFSAKFGYYLLSHMNLRKYRGGSGLPFLTYSMLNEMETVIPLGEPERVKIAELFTRVDNIIALHQHKIDKMKEYKKGLLQQMFV